MTYNIWETENNVQLIPDGEEIIHQFDIMCGCSPDFNMNGEEIVEVFHNSFIGENFEYIFNPIKQTKDC